MSLQSGENQTEKQELNMKNQVAIVTGGSRGIGRAICLRLASQGADLVLNYTSNETAAKETAELCEAYGSRVITVQADVSNSEDVDRLFEAAVSINGRVDILVNNAGITKDNLMLRMSIQEFEQVVETNLTGTFLCMKKAARLMLRQKYGRIINLSSVVGIRGNAGQVNYSASKAGVIGMTKSLAKEMASRNVTVNAVAPGMIQTGMSGKMTEDAKKSMLATIPCGRIGTGEDVANAVAFFAKKESGYITGQVLCIDGGMAV